MANLSITSSCNRDCPYCFALPTLEARDAPREMTMEVFHRSLDFLERSGIEQVRLLGGEPTLHSNFVDMLEIAFERGFQVLVFTGGLISNRATEAMLGAPVGRLTVHMNTGVPGIDSEDLIDRQQKTLGKLGEIAMVGVNITSPTMSFDYLLQWIDQFGLRRAVRLGITHPILGEENQFLHPRHYPAVGERAALFVLEARLRHVEVDFDCGWVPCMFPPGAMETLGITPQDVGLRCNPILDILSDGQAISCYPLSEHHKIPITDESEAKQIRTQFVERQARDRTFFLYQACESCEFRHRGECSGGCLSGSLRRLRVTAVNSTEQTKCDEQPPAGGLYKLSVIS